MENVVGLDKFFIFMLVSVIRKNDKKMKGVEGFLNRN